VSKLIHHEGTKDTKKHEVQQKPQQIFLLLFVLFVPFVPSW